MGSELRQLAVVSGKGGTGKTTVLGAFAALAGESVLADCDVDAADLHLLLHPRVKESHDFYGAKVAVRDDTLCRGAGECERLCRFEAITKDAVNAYACEGCGVCVEACPNGALRLETIKTVLIDGPPGIGCTATAAMVDVSLALIVTEPTLSGRHDLERVIELAGILRIPCAVAVNKADINAENTAAIGAFCEERDVPVLALIPFDDAVPRAIGAGSPLVEFDNGPAAVAIRRLWDSATRLMG
jgi:MinD superfamily P-loop ATPase